MGGGLAPTRIELLQRMPVFGAIGEAGLDQLRILKASLRFKETRDPSVL